MVDYSEDDLDLVFHALSDRTRRDILKKLAWQDLGIRALADEYDMTLAGVSKHVRVLERAGLVTVSKEGRIHRCVMQFAPLEKAAGQIEFYRRFWTQRLDHLDDYVQAMISKKTDKRRKQ